MPKISLRQAVQKDAAMIFEWRNTPFIMALGSQRRLVTWDEHLEWFKKSLRSKDRKIFIVLLNEKPIGQVRFDRLDSRRAAISVYVLQEYTGMGYGREAIMRGCWEMFAEGETEKILAHVRHDNPRSKSAFMKCGFVELFDCPDEPEGHFHLLLERSAFRNARIPLDIPEKARHPGAFRVFTPSVDDISDRLIPHNRLTFGKEEAAAVLKVVKSGYWAGGCMVSDLERRLASICNKKLAVCTSSGTGALRLALLALKIRPGDQVVLPAYSCVSLANAILAVGAIPIPADISPETFNLTYKTVENVFGKQTRAIIAVHTFGMPVEIKELKRFGVPVIEDCAHGLGPIDHGPILGEEGDIAVCSFYATKLVGGGEGGAIATDKSAIADFVRSWRDCTDQPPEATRLNDKMNDLEAALALTQLDRLPRMIEKRALAAEIYHEKLASSASGNMIFELPDHEANRIWYRYIVRLTGISAARMIDELAFRGIKADLPITKWHANYAGTPCVDADRAFEQNLSLPFFPTLASKEQARVCRAFIRIVEEIHERK